MTQDPTAKHNSDELDDAGLEQVTGGAKEQFVTDKIHVALSSTGRKPAQQGSSVAMEELQLSHEGLTLDD